eukprot:2861496-Rhodomonas_salina.5
MHHDSTHTHQIPRAPLLHRDYPNQRSSPATRITCKLANIRQPLTSVIPALQALGQKLAYGSAYAAGGATPGTMRYQYLCLRPHYAMSESDVSCSDICLRAPYPMSGIDLPADNVRSAKARAMPCPAVTYRTTDMCLLVRALCNVR